MRHLFKKYFNLSYIVSFHKGFTLLELLAVFAVIGSLTALGLASYSSFNAQQTLTSTSADIAALLSTAKSRAISQVVPTSCTGSLTGYEVDPNKPSVGQYTLYADCGNQVSVVTNKLPTSVTFNGASSPAVQFAVATGAVDSQQSIILSLAGYGSSTVSVDTTGIIAIQVNTNPVTITPSPTAPFTPTDTPPFQPQPTPTEPAQPPPTVANCQPSAMLVNPCRPWIGTVAGGNPQAASDNISQFDYFEQLSGRQMDLFHDYHVWNNLPLNSDEIYFAHRPNTYIYVNWKVADNWLNADGGDATVQTNIDKVAANIKAIAPLKIFLTLWHEPENDVTPGTSSCPGLKGTSGSPAQYRGMWQNVENRFNADGVTNVVWVMNYMGYYAWDCLVPEMWPGNSLVNWVAFDTYGTDGTPTWAGTVGRFYNVLQNDESSTTDFTSKPWAAGEFGTCLMTNESNVYTYLQSIKQAIDANSYPRIKMYLFYGTTAGPSAGIGCVTNYSSSGTLDSTKQTYWNQIANDPIFNASQ